MKQDTDVSRNGTPVVHGLANRRQMVAGTLALVASTALAGRVAAQDEGADLSSDGVGATGRSSGNNGGNGLSSDGVGATGRTDAGNGGNGDDGLSSNGVGATGRTDAGGGVRRGNREVAPDSVGGGGRTDVPAVMAMPVVGSGSARQGNDRSGWAATLLAMGAVGAAGVAWRTASGSANEG